MSLDQAAEHTGVSKSMLAQIERGVRLESIAWSAWKDHQRSSSRIPGTDPAAERDRRLVTPEELLPTKELEGQYLCLDLPAV